MAENQKVVSAIAGASVALQQVNSIIPIAVAAVTAIVNIVKGFKGTSPDADVAIAEFEAKAAEITATAKGWLEAHPEEPHVLPEGDEA